MFERTYTSRDFTADYNALGGSALGLAHTMRQTIFRPSNVSKKLPNLYYVGAGTNPGIGMPICLISAELAYKRIIGDRSPGPLPVETVDQRPISGRARTSCGCRARVGTVHRS